MCSGRAAAKQLGVCISKPCTHALQVPTQPKKKAAGAPVLGFPLGAVKGGAGTAGAGMPLGSALGGAAARKSGVQPAVGVSMGLQSGRQVSATWAFTEPATLSTPLPAPLLLEGDRIESPCPMLNLFTLHLNCSQLYKCSSA